MKILVSEHNFAANYYRITCPFGVLTYRTDIDAQRGNMALGIAGEFDALWLQMDADSFAYTVAREFKDAGKPVIYDVDDWLFEMPSSWYTYDDWFTRGIHQAKNRLAFHQKMLELADIITTTTPYLASKITDGLPDAKKVRILPNYIMRGDWDTLLPVETNLDDDRPIVGWFGTSNHWDDFFEIAPYLDEALAAIDAHFIVIGFPEVVTCFPERLRKRTFLQPLVPMRSFSEVRKMIKAFDIGIAWATERTETSRCRSNLKALQYAAAGVPCIGSENVYACSVNVAAESIEKLYEIICNFAAIGKDGLRGIGVRNQKLAFEVDTYEQNATKWLYVLEEVL